MGKIVLLIGPSASGKDTLLREVKNLDGMEFKDIILHTTRPMRVNEENGREYYFCSEEEMQKLEEEGKIIERRTYNTIYGPWHYFTVSSEFNLKEKNYIGLNTLEGLDQYLKFYNKEDIISFYIHVDEEVRLERALEREKREEKPKYKELCRRFLADCEDFSQENIRKRPITACIDNSGEINDSVKQIEKVLRKSL